MIKILLPFSLLKDHKEFSYTIKKELSILNVEIKSNHKQEFKEILIKMNDLLDEHIKVHDGIFNPSKRAMIPIPFIFKKIDFKNLYEDSEKVKDGLESCFEQLKVIVQDGTELDQLICEEIRDYGTRFLASNSKLTEITFELHLKALRENKLSYKEHRRLVEEYKENETKRLQKGDAMNEIASVVNSL